MPIRETRSRRSQFLFGGSTECEWWAMCDLNARPSRCKRDALTSELTAHIMLSEGHASVNRTAGYVLLACVVNCITLTFLCSPKYTECADKQMLLSRDFVGHMSKEVVRRLVDRQMIETKSVDLLSERVRQTMVDELTVEDRLNEEVRDILAQHNDEMRKVGASYQEMYKKVKGELARQRKLILR
jgi:hypothetical protein